MVDYVLKGLKEEQLAAISPTQTIEVLEQM